MPDTRTRRGPHPKDEDCFSPPAVPALRAAVADLSWLLSRGYSQRAALKLVGDRYALRDRQRKALQRCAASDEACRQRRSRRLPPARLAGETVAVDGYNVLLTIEAALSGAVLLLGRDGALRDLAAMSAHYRRVDSTVSAIGLLADFFAACGCDRVVWCLDRPVSNSGRLKRLIEEAVDGRQPPWEVRLLTQTDRTLATSAHVVATADSAILDRCRRWVNLARLVVDRSIPSARILDLGSAPSAPPSSGSR